MISDQDSPQVKVAKGAAIIMAGLVFARLVNYSYQILISRLAGADEFGLFFLGVVTLSMAGGIATLGIDHGVARFAPLYHGGGDDARLKGVLRRSFLLALVNGAIAGVALLLLAEPLAKLYFADHPARGAEIIRICAAAMPFFASGRVLIKAVVAFQRIGYRVAVNQFVTPMVRLALTALLLTAGLGAEAGMWAYAASEAVSWAVLLWLLQRKVYPVFGSGPGVFDLRPYLSYCMPLFLSVIVVQVMNYIDALMAGYYLDSAQVGIYGAAVRLAALVAVGNELLNPLFLSIITGAHAGGRHDLVGATFNNNNRWFLYLGLPVTCLLAVLAPQAMSLVWGPGFAAGATPLAVLIVGRTVHYLAATSSLLLSMYARTRLILLLNLVAAAANFSLNWLLIPRLGIEGAALATSISLSLHGVLTILYARRTHGRDGLRVVFPRLLAAAAVACLPAVWLGSLGLAPLAALLAGGAAYLAAFGLLLKAFGAFSDDDRRIWNQLRRRLGIGGSQD